MYKYVNKYRVVCEFDRVSLKPIKNDTYIYCKNGGQIYRYNDEVLVYYRPNISKGSYVIKAFNNANVEVLYNGNSDEEVYLRFRETDIEKVANIVGVRTLGASIKPYSVKNLRLFSWYKNKTNEDINSDEI